MNPTSIKYIKEVLREAGARPRKSLGQNFLTDSNITAKIAQASASSGDKYVLEIGPGLGGLTCELAKHFEKVVCIEKDKTLSEILIRDTVSEAGNVNVMQADFLKVDIESIVKSPRWACVGNLPYYISTPILITLLEHHHLFSSITVMLQKELADRARANPGTKDYGSLSVFLQYRCNILSVCKASRNVFYPPPDVDSEVIKLDVLDEPAVQVSDEQVFFRVVRAAFGKRRKTILNSLGDYNRDLTKDDIADVLKESGIDPTRRAETLSIAEFAVITENIYRVEQRKQ